MMDHYRKVVFLMKKWLSLVLTLMMVLASVSALAEEVYFDESFVANIPGEFVLLEELGLVFYLPETMQAMEMTEADIAGGGIAAFTDGTASVSIAYAPVADGAGAPITTLEQLIDFYNASGITTVFRMLNDIPCAAFSVEDPSLSGIAYVDGSGNVLAFTGTPLTEEVAVMLTSIMAYAE